MPSPHAPLRLRDVGAEAALIAGGGRAVLLQLANPAIGHAIARHSGFASDPVRRLRHTLAFVYALVYGTPEQVAAVRAGVNRRHAPVKYDAQHGGGTPTEAAVPSYDATDPALQLWVAATLYDTAVTVRRELIGPLSPSDLDAIYLDYEIIGTALQVPPGMWPRDRAAFDEYWSGQLGGLRVDDTVRGVADALLHPRSGPIWLRAGMPLARLVTAGLLPLEVRAQFGLRWGPRRERRFVLALAVLRGVNRVLPRRVREWPKTMMLSHISVT